MVLGSWFEGLIKKEKKLAQHKTVTGFLLVLAFSTSAVFCDTKSEMLSPFVPWPCDVLTGSLYLILWITHVFFFFF